MCTLDCLFSLNIFFLLLLTTSDHVGWDDVPEKLCFYLLPSFICASLFSCHIGSIRLFFYD
jgi:inner membrane protein involved in colicin E2 resistance